jgi:hypothetical protein
LKFYFEIFLAKSTIDFEKELVVINTAVFGNYNATINTCFADVAELGAAPMTFFSDAHVSTYLTLLKQSNTFALKSF